MSDTILPTCTSIKHTLSILSGKWKPLIIFLLSKQTLRFTELQKSIGTITQKMLAQELRKLESAGLIKRKVYPVIPPKVEYSLTKKGISLLPILDQMNSWGQKHQ